MNKRVSFDEDVLINVDECHMEDRRKMYLSRSELHKLQEDIFDEADWARSLGAKTMQRNDHLRGLEMMIDGEAGEERLKEQFLGQLAVFMEQDRQFLEDGTLTPNDFDSMAFRYGKITKHNKDLARKRAILDQEIEKVNNNEAERKAEKGTRIPMPTASVEPRPRFSVGPSAA